MKKNKFILTSVFVVLFGFSSFSQGGGLWNFDWNIGFGLGETRDFVSATSLRGFSIDGRGFVSNSVTVGGFIGWNTFFQSDGYETNSFGNTGSVYGYDRKYINAMPLMVNSHYYFSQAIVMSYIGLGVGTMYVKDRDFTGIYYVENDAWHFALAPELGVVIPFGNSNTGFNANVKYNWAAKTRETPDYSFITFNIGISYVF